MDIEENIIMFEITSDQAERICKHFNKDIKDLEEYEVCELLDKYINEL